MGPREREVASGDLTHYIDIGSWAWLGKSCYELQITANKMGNKNKK